MTHRRVTGSARRASPDCKAGRDRRAGRERISGHDRSVCRLNLRKGERAGREWIVGR